MRIRVLVVAISCAFLSVASTADPLCAGLFAAARGCDSLQVGPPQVLDRFIFLDVPGVYSLCRIEVESASYVGSALVPIVGAVSSSQVTAAFDSTTGVATFSVDPCVAHCCWAFDDGFGILTNAPGGCFFLTLYGIFGLENTQYVCFTSPCTVPTPTRPETWGALKATYR